MSFEQAAAIPQAAMLAVQGLIDQGHIQQGQKILINGAGGGVGTFGLQIAKLYGANITVVDSAAKLDMLLSLGADKAIDYAKEGIRVNAVCPGLMETPMVNRLTAQPGVGDTIRDTIPMGRSAHPSEVAKAVLFLASDDASYITGHGRHLKSHRTGTNSD